MSGLHRSPIAGDPDVRGAPGHVHTPVSVEAPALVDAEKFDHSYRCTHCGHRWMEIG